MHTFSHVVGAVVGVDRRNPTDVLFIGPSGVGKTMLSSPVCGKLREYSGWVEGPKECTGDCCSWGPYPWG
jgi:ABC-type transporter Mla maintaining outer membrane lipid asymmetry ATPase subunit MlaF